MLQDDLFCSDIFGLIECTEHVERLPQGAAPLQAAEKYSPQNKLLVAPLSNFCHILVSVKLNHQYL